MIRIDAAPIADRADIAVRLQTAIRLEHATIPPYLAAFYTLKRDPAGARFARQQIRSIVNQEMMHMAQVCNILNAIGGHPLIDDPTFLLPYPSPLPMAIAGGVEVPIKRYSRTLVADVFLAIEKPEVALEIPIRALDLVAARIATIGQFYADIRAAIMREGEALFAGADPASQVQVLGAIVVHDVATAVAGIDQIVHQGEGTTQSPASGSAAGQLAHYYRFEQLVKGMKAVPDATPFGFHYDPVQLIVIDDSGDVIQMVDNPQQATLGSQDSEAALKADVCDRAYTAVLKALHQGFNGRTAAVKEAIDLMTNTLEPAIEAVLGVTIQGGPAAGQRAGPRFAYLV